MERKILLELFVERLNGPTHAVNLRNVLYGEFKVVGQQYDRLLVLMKDLHSSRLMGQFASVERKRVRDAAFFLTIMFVTFAATLLKPQNYVSSRTIRKCVEQVSTSTEP